MKQSKSVMKRIKIQNKSPYPASVELLRIVIGFIVCVFVGLFFAFLASYTGPYS